MSAPDERTSSPRPRVFRKTFTRRPADHQENREGSREQHARPHRQQHGYQLRRPGRPQRDPAKLQQERAEARRNNIAKYREAARREKNAQAPSRAYVPVGDPEPLTGILEITPKGFGFIRTADNNWAPSETAIYVPEDIITTHRLRPYVQVSGMAQRYERGHQLISVSAVNGLPPEQAAAAPHFEDLKAVNPTHRLAFETTSSRFTTRTLDLMAPVARGQRGLIVAPPRTGKTTLLMHIAEGAIKNYGEDLHLMVLLVDERPEEVTEFKRQLPEAEIFASSNDSPVREH